MTDQNTDPDKRRPKFDSSTAKEIFDELIKRGLLVERKVDSTGVPAYIMNFDLDGWDKAVSDGRWLRGKCLTIKRNWVLIVVIFIGTCVITTIENRVVGFIDGCIDVVFPAKAKSEPNDAPRVNPKVANPKEQQGEPNKEVNPSGGSGGL